MVKEKEGITPEVGDAMTFSEAKDNPRRERTTLYVVVYKIRDGKRRARVKRILASFGLEVGLHTFEVPTSPTGIRALERALSQELFPEDDARLYPVCNRCRSETRVWGEGELAGLSPAIIF